MTDSGILDGPAGNLLDRPLGDPRRLGDRPPGSLGPLERVQDELMHRLFSHDGGRDYTQEWVFSTQIRTRSAPIVTGVSDKKEGKRGQRPPSTAAKRLRRVLKANIKVLFEREYPLSKYRIKSEAEKVLGADAGLSPSSVQRALNPDKGMTIDLLADIAAAFSVKPAQLLDPAFADIVKSAPDEPKETPGSGTLQPGGSRRAPPGG
jgi:hypothetical protein